MISNKWLLLFAVRIRHAAASCGGAVFAGAGTAAAIKLSCILSAQFNYHRYFLVSHVNHCAAATVYEDRLGNNPTVYRSPSVNSGLALGQPAGRRCVILLIARQFRLGAANVEPPNLLPTGY